jgi:hypothetical protein
MKKKKNIVLSLGILLILTTFFCGCIFRMGEYIYEYSDFEFDADENTLLEVRNINGEIDVIGWNEDIVSLNFIKRTSELFGEEEFDKVEINVNEIDNKITSETIFLENNVHVSVFIKIQVPMDINVEHIETFNGGVYLSNFSGNTKVITRNGPIYIDNVDGYVEAENANGLINIKDTKGVSNIITHNGIINTEIHDFKKDIEIKSANGNIEVQINPDLDAVLYLEAIGLSTISLNDMVSLLDITEHDLNHIKAILGDGGNVITIRISNGFINLFKLDS